MAGYATICGPFDNYLGRLLQYTSDSGV